MTHKLCLIVFVLSFFTQTNGQNCTDLYIAGVLDGPLGGGTPKMIQVCANKDITDLSIYALGSANNGGGSDGIEYTLPAIPLDSSSCFTVASESTGFINFFNCPPDDVSSVANINGNDAIELFCNGVLSDLYGDQNADGSGEPWDYLDGWAISTDTIPDINFDASDWIFSGANALDGESSNTTATTPYPLSACTNNCVISTVLIGTQSTCNPNTNTYTQDIEITYSMAPSSGMLNVNGQLFTITNSPQTVTLNNLTSNSNQVDLNVFFTNLPSCSFNMTNAFTAPNSCASTPSNTIVDTLKIMTYNLLNFPNPSNNDPLGSDAARLILFRNLIDSINPDVILIQELKTLQGMIDLTDELNSNSSLGFTYMNAPMYTSYSGLGNGLIYKTDKFYFESQQELARTNSLNAPNGGSVVAPRANSLYNLKATNNNCLDSIDIDLISLHLKAGSSDASGNSIADRENRNLGILDALDWTELQSQSANIIIAGDTNFRSDDNNSGGDSEPGYVNLIDINNSPSFVDPLNGFVRNQSSDAHKYTQATRSSGINHYGNGGVSGGLDDRFDFIFFSDAINNNLNKANYLINSHEIPGSPQLLNTASCSSGLPNCTDYLIMSDHYPVTIDVIFTFDQCGTPCVQDLVISQDYINGEIEILEASQTIQADNTIGNNSNIQYQAGQSIDLNGGFEVTLNAIFEAFIDDCFTP